MLKNLDKTWAVYRDSGERALPAKGTRWFTKAEVRELPITLQLEASGVPIGVDGNVVVMRRLCVRTA